MEPRRGGRRSRAVEEGEVVSWKKEEPRCPVTKEEGCRLARHRASCCRLSLRKKGGATMCLHGREIERERVIAAALNLGEIEMNGRERLYGRERESHGRKERESWMLLQDVREKRKREKYGSTCV
jgi:hypothetical protein